VIKGKYLIELAQFIPSRNINFYIDACRRMMDVDFDKISGSSHAALELKHFKSLISNGELRTNPQAAIEAMMNDLKKPLRIDSVKLLGYFILSYLRDGEFNEHKKGGLLKHPFNFISFAIVEDLKLHGQGPGYSLVEKFLDELVQEEIIDSRFHGLHVRNRCTTYSSFEDIAAMFLGFSLACNGAFRPMVPFPRKPEGFISRMIFELKKLLPEGEPVNTFVKQK
jgi:hypothetical protein